MTIRFFYVLLVILALSAPYSLIAGGSSFNAVEMQVESSQMGAHMPETKVEPEKSKEKNQPTRKATRLWTVFFLIVISGVAYYSLRRRYLKKLTTKQ